MNRYIKVTATLAAFALLLVVMGLSTQGAVNAQSPDARTLTLVVQSNQVDSTDTDIAVRSTYLCSDITPPVACTAGEDDTFTIALTGTGEAMVKITNLDLSEVDDTIEQDGTASDGVDDVDDTDGSDANPKTIMIPSGQPVTVTAVHKSSGLSDGRDNRDGTDTNQGPNVYQVKAFHGNRIRITYNPVGELGTSKTLNVDNVPPSVVLNSPVNDLVVKKGVNVTFSADVTDNGAGFASKEADVLESNTLEATRPDSDLNDVKGRVQLFVGRYPVVLTASDFTAIDDGWRVSKILASGDIAGLGDKVPFYFSVEDLAGNSKESSGNTNGKTDAAGDPAGTTLAVGDLADAGYRPDVFVGRSIRYTTPSFSVPLANIQAFDVDHDGDGGEDSPTADIPFTPRAAGTAASTTKTEPIMEFASDTGVFTLAAGDAFMASVTVVGTIQDQTADDGEVDDPTTTWSEVDTDPFTATTTLARAIPSGTTFDIVNTQAMTVDGAAPTLGTPKAVTGHAWGGSPAKQLIGKSAKKNSIQVTFIDKGGLETGSVVPAAFGVTGNTVTSTLVIDTKGKSLAAGEEKAANSFLVFLTLGDNLGSNERPTITINSGVIKDRAGNAFGGDTIKADDRLGPNLSLSKSDALSNKDVRLTVSTDEQLSAAPRIWVTAVSNAAGDVARVEPVGSVTPVTALSYGHTAKVGALGSGEYNVYSEGTDTQHTMNTGKIGNSTKANTASSFTFELDNELNGGELPTVKVGPKVAATGTDTAPKVEQVDPLTVTVNFTAEGGEYLRDSYRSVDLLSAKLKVDFADGTSETTNYNLTTDVRSQDNVQFTIALVIPKVGTYTLTVTAQDEAGNNRRDGSGTSAENLVSKWEVVPARPVDIDLEPGWNLISLPFHPGSPAINSVIPETHPADIVMTYDNASKVWRVSRRDAETGKFVGDIAVLTANTAYFVRSSNFQPIELLRPPAATAGAAPPIPSNIPVSKGWNLVPVVTIEVPIPAGLAADDYFGSLGSAGGPGWLRALTFNTLPRTWDAISPGETMTLRVGETNPCTGREVGKDSDDGDTTNIEDGTEPCQAAEYNDRSTAGGADDGEVNKFDESDTVAVRVPVKVGKGYWIFVTNEDGEIIP